MKNIFAIILCIILFSCSKQEETHEMTLESQIVTALNVKDISKAEVLINQALARSPGNGKFLYYKAQLNALEAQIDIYSLFPIVKMELFEFALTEWSAIDEYGDHLRDTGQDVVIGQNSSNTEEEIRERIKEIDELDNDEVSYELEVVNRYESIEPYSDGYCYLTLKLTSNIFPSKYEFWDSQSFSGTDITCDIAEEKIMQPGWYSRLIKVAAIKEYNDVLLRKKTRRESNRILKAMISVYQSINVIKNVPMLHNFRYEKVKESLILLKRVKETKGRVVENSKKHQAMLSGYLILGSLRNSLDLENIKNPSDVVCKLDAHRFVSQYEYLLTGFRYLYDAMIGTEFSKKNVEKFIKLKEQLDNANEELSKEKIDEYIDDIQDYQEDYC